MITLEQLSESTTSLAAAASASAAVTIGVATGALLLALDALDQALAFHGRSGGMQHANAAFRRALADPEVGRVLDGEVRRFSAALWGLANARGITSGAVRLDTRGLRLPRGEYRMQGAFVGADLFGQGESVLVAVRVPDPDPLAVEHLRERFGLTPRQSRVARLLVQGLKNEEIARRLFISAHTARHHTEQIKAKVGGSTRAAVAARILHIDAPETR